jgi:molybdopterin-guanine dinucleotide biosynthesis protein A
VVLAGGRGSRLGGREKGEIRLQGRRLIDIVVGAALETGSEKVIIAGDVEAEGAVSIREEPPFGGPAAGLAAALPHLESEWILLLACDLPHARLLCHLLFESFREVDPETDGLVALHENRVQWLAGLYRRRSIEAALARFGEAADASMKDLFGPMMLREVQDPEGLSRDIDTPAELEEWTRQKEVER